MYALSKLKKERTYTLSQLGLSLYKELQVLTSKILKGSVQHNNKTKHSFCFHLVGLTEFTSILYLKTWTDKHKLSVARTAGDTVAQIF